MSPKKTPEKPEKPPSQQAMEAAVAHQRDGDDSLVTLSNGVRLRLHPVTPDAVRVVIQRLRRPKPPVIFMEDKGREEENPDHPDYLAALEEHAELVQETGVNVLLALGTSLEHVPEGIEGPDDPGWQEVTARMAYFGIDLDLEDPRGRYLAWLRFYALTTDKDMLAVLASPALRAGLTEEEVNAAVESFRRGA